MFSQNTIKLKSGGSFKGQVYLPEKGDDSVRLNKSDGTFKFYNLDAIKYIKDGEGEIIWSYEKYIADINAERLKVECNKNKDIKCIILPFQNDYYGLSDDTKDAYEKACFDVKSNIHALEFLSEKNVELNNLNDFYLKKIGESNNVDIIFHGYTYLIDVPYKNSPIVSKNPLNDLAESADLAFDWSGGYF